MDLRQEEEERLMIVHRASFIGLLVKLRTVVIVILMAVMVHLCLLDAALPRILSPKLGTFFFFLLIFLRVSLCHLLSHFQVLRQCFSHSRLKK